MRRTIAAVSNLRGIPGLLLGRWSVTRATLFAFLLMLMVACEPRFIQTSHEVDGFLARQDYRAACVGLKMRNDPDLQTYTAKKLSEYSGQTTANACICRALYDASEHRWDPAVAKGLKGSKRDFLASCLVPALKDPEVADRKALVEALADIDAKSARQAIWELAKAGGGDLEVRVAAVEALARNKRATELLLVILERDKQAPVRAAAARSLKGRDGREVVRVISQSAETDADGEVRAAALDAVVRLKVPRTDEMVCKAMLEDPDARVRLAAVKAVHGSKREPSIRCLKKRLNTLEEDAGVRGATIAALGASPNQKAANVLCDSVGPFLRMYVTDKLQSDVPATDIMKAQNDRDYERSWECVAKARSQGGYSCFARHYLAVWVQDLGGKASLPLCPGMMKLSK